MRSCTVDDSLQAVEKELEDQLKMSHATANAFYPCLVSGLEKLSRSKFANRCVDLPCSSSIEDRFFRKIDNSLVESTFCFKRVERHFVLA